MWYTSYSGRRKSSVPLHLTAWNGLNFSRSVGNPDSRLEKIRTYLRTMGPRTKREILRDVFNKTDVVIRGWGVYVFTYGVLHGFFRKERKGNVTYWSVV